MKGPDLAALLAAQDDTGAALAELVRLAHGGPGRLPPGNGNGSAPVTPQQFMAQKTSSRPWDDIAATLAAEGRNNGVMRLACSLRETTSLSEDEAIDQMYERVWPLVDQGQGGHEFPAAEFEEVIRAIWRQYPGAGEKIRAATAAIMSPPPALPGAAGPQPPGLPESALELTDAFITNRVAWTLNDGGMNGPYRWAPGLGWMRWRVTRWMTADVADVWEEVRQYFIWLLNAVSDRSADQALLARLVALLTKARIGAITDLCRGHPLIRCDAADFDNHPDLLNTPAGVVDLRTGDVTPHDPALLLTKITSGNYIPGYTHPDWEQALTALDEPERLWYQARVGQAITGYPTPDGIMPVLQGSGENGKSCLTTDGPVKALGGYADMASHKLIASQRANATEHSTEMADLRGQRLLIGEELSEGRSIDVTALKRIQDVGRIKARYVHKDNITFDASHSLFVTSNYKPQISETDHGTWRRLALLVFPYTYRKPDQELAAETDRHGDPGLKHRIRYDLGGQHDAIVTWAVGGAIGWYAGGQAGTPVTPRIADDTREWRKSADRILCFWDEFLIADPGTAGEHPPCIGAGYLTGLFNSWLAKNGHAAWAKETVSMRFGTHEETTSQGVRYQVTAKLANLSRYTGSDLYSPADHSAQQLRAWVGVRFQTRADQGQQVPLDLVDAPETNVPSEPSRETFVSTPSTQSSAPICLPPGAVSCDLETGSAKDLFTYTQRDETGYVRLAGVLGTDGQPVITSATEVIDLLRAADEICGHNFLGFDLLALAWHYGADWDTLAPKVRDSEIIARQANPPRSRESGTSQDLYDLDHVAAWLGLPGKTDNLARLKRVHKGYDTIPLDDREYQEYLVGDLRATAAVAERLHHDTYTAREHVLATLAGRMSLNGFLVDQDLLAQRIRETADRSRTALRKLHEVLGLPLGKAVLRGRGADRHEEQQLLDSPLSSDAGRAWLAGIWEEFGVTDPPVTTKTGRLSVGASDLRQVAARRPDLAGLCETIITAAWPRTVYQTASDCLAPDGRVHPGISMRQASGRWSVTNPGLTVFGKRGGRHVERDIFLPDEGHVLLSFDLSQVDMRAMAWLSEDHAYRALFARGRDAHTEIGNQVGLDRQSAKMVGHGWNYGLGAPRMKREGMDPVMVDTFIAGMEAQFPVLIDWRKTIRDIGSAGEILENGFGRYMRCDPARAYTVAPALMGQGGARDIMCESLLRLPRETWPMLRVMVHDEILLSVPKTDARDVAETVMQAMQWDLAEDLPVLCDMSMGMSWGECSAK